MIKEERWIPCSERLPRDRREVLVTAYWHGIYQVMMASYFGNGLWWCVPFNNSGEHTQRLRPKAWMPLPKPYKEDLRDICNERIEIECTHGTCKDCFYYNIDEDGHGYHCEKYGHTRFPVYADFYCKDFEKRGGENELN